MNSTDNLRSVIIATITIALPVCSRHLMAQNATFEVASVKLAQTTLDAKGRPRCPGTFKIDRAQIDIECAGLRDLIGYAFGISPLRVTGPGWLEGPQSPKFTIIAKLPQGASESQIPRMLRALLQDRLKLAAHRGTKVQPVYALLVAKGGLNVKEANTGSDPLDLTLDSAPPDTIPFGDVQTHRIRTRDNTAYNTAYSNPRMGTVRETNAPNGLQRWEAPGTTFAGLADLLDKVAPLSLPIIDMTGVKGRYQLVLETSLNDAMSAMANAGNDPNARENALMDLDASVLTAFNHGLAKIGLRLERRNESLDILVVDNVEKTPTAN